MPAVYFAFARLQTIVISSSLEDLLVKKTRVQPHNKEKVPLWLAEDRRQNFRGNGFSWDPDWYDVRVEVPEESAFVSNLSCKWNTSDDLNLVPHWPFLHFKNSLHLLFRINVQSLAQQNCKGLGRSHSTCVSSVWEQWLLLTCQSQQH